MPGWEWDERARLWDARHRAYRTIREAHLGWGILIADAAVPRSLYPDLAATARGAVDRRGITAYMLGHAGLGTSTV